MFTVTHVNLNVQDLERSVAFYEKALDLKVTRRREAEDGSFILCFLAAGSVSIELTWLRDHAAAPYDLGDNESHIGFVADDYAAARSRHQEMDCICYENTAMGLYFIEDPDGYWLEIVPRR